LNLLQEIPHLEYYIKKLARPKAVELIQEVYFIKFNKIYSFISAFSIAASEITMQMDLNCHV